MNGEYMSLETAKKIVEMQKQIETLTKSALRLNEIVKEKQQEIERLKSLWETDRQSWNEQMAELTEKNERLNNIINKALHKLRASKDHFKTERENNAITFTIRILEGEDKE